MSFPSSRPPTPHAATLNRLTALVTSPDRAEAIRQLAAHCGVDHLVIFVSDPDLGVLLPARGFPQTLPRGSRWHRFVAACTPGEIHAGRLTPPGGAGDQAAAGIAAADGSVLVLVGGSHRLDAIHDVVALLPLVAAALRGEQAVSAAEAHAAAARQAADDARILVNSLDSARSQLQDALIEVESALQMRQEFLSIASHELKTPLTGLMLQAQMLQRLVRRFPSEDRNVERMCDTTAAMERQVKRLTKLTNELLDTSRISSGKLELNRELMELAELAHDVVARFSDEAASHGCTLHLHVETLIEGCWDRLRIDQVITNLLSNAIKYGAGAPIEVTVGIDGDLAVIVVRDRGVGIEPDDIERIFQRFERVRLSGDPGGLGLGLYITRQIVDMHGGRIEVSSVRGEGSTFTVRLPDALALVSGTQTAV